MRQTGGTISVEGQLGLGSTFTVYLPATNEPLPQADNHEYKTMTRGSEAILVVEDRTEIRRLISTILSRSGYSVILAPDALEALRILTDPPAPIALLLTDVVMPHMSGRELAKFCQAQHPEIRVLYMSGYPDDVVGQHGLLEPGLAFIQKPFAGPLLLQRVRAALDTPGAGAVGIEDRKD